jgi:hypothetical protein
VRSAPLGEMAMPRRDNQRASRQEPRDESLRIRLFVPLDESPELALSWLTALIQLCTRGSSAAQPDTERPMAAASQDVPWDELIQQGLIAPDADHSATGDRAPMPRYVLTVLGARAIEQLATTARSVLNDHVRPLWDRQRRVLSFDGAPVIRFDRRSPNQQSILDAFQDAGWPERIEDPLGAADEIPAAARLHDTIKCLNRRLGRTAPFRFAGDGTGCGVRWELRAIH